MSKLYMITEVITLNIRGGSRISEREVWLYKGVWVRFADFISVFKYPMKMK